MNVKNDKKGAGSLLLTLVVIGLAIFAGMGAVALYHNWKGDTVATPDAKLAVAQPDGSTTTATPQQVADAAAQKTLTSCDGIASVKILYNDQNGYTSGTDPNTTMTLYNPIKKTVADDATATTVPVLSTLKGLAGNSQGTPSTTYFGKEVSFSTVCGDVEFQPELYEASAPTITIVNDNGVTLNSDSNNELEDGDSEYTAYITAKAPAKKCASVYGAAVVFEYDASYVNSIESADLSDYSVTLNIPHVTNQSGASKDFDQYKVMKYDGELCDGAKVSDISFTVKTTSSAPGEDQANVKIHWLPLNKDLNVDDYTVITGLYDEDNNAIYKGNTSTYYYAG